MLYLIIPLVARLDEPFMRIKIQKFFITAGIISGLKNMYLMRALWIQTGEQIEKKILIF